MVENKLIKENQEQNQKKPRKKRTSLKTIYIYYAEDSVENVDYAIGQLEPDEKAILDKLFGNDYHQPQKGVLTCAEKNKLHKKVLPKMNQILLGIREGTIVVVKESLNKGNPNSGEVEAVDLFCAMPSFHSDFTKEDYEAMRSYLMRDEFQDAIKSLPLEECVVAALSLSLVGEKPVSLSTISQLLGISSEDAVTMTKKGLFAMKETFDTKVEEEGNFHVKRIGGNIS